MKKLLMAFVCLFALAALVACGNNEEENNETPATEATYTLGMGVVVDAAYGYGNYNLEVSSTVATVVLDSEGKIVLCRIDVAQNKIAHTANGLVAPAEYLTKMELGDDYGMADSTDNDGNGVMLEWYDQTYAFEKHVIGMTAQQVKDMPTQTLPNHYVISNDKALLDAGCSMQIVEFKAAVAKACEDAQAVTFTTDKAFTLGVAANSADNGSTATTAKVYSDFAAAVVADGKILAALNDAVQPVVEVTTEKTVVVPANGHDFRTKREKMEDYGMAEAEIDNDNNGVTLEWYEQSLAFSKYVVGMTATQVSELDTVEAAGHYISTDKALLDAGCSMQITGLMAVVAKAANNAR